MARPSGPKTRNSGNWTEARFKSFITNLLRSGTKRWGPKQEAKKEARVKRGFYLCEGCKEEIPAKKREGVARVDNVFVDHIKPVVDPDIGFEDWNKYIEGLFCEKDNLQVLCKDCHKEKTKEENDRATKRRSKK